MKNLLLALAGTLMLSASTNAQTSYYVYMYEPDNWQNAKAYESQVVNTNGTTQNVQLVAYSGNGNWPATINMTLDFSTGEITLPEVDNTVLSCDDLFTDWLSYVEELYYQTDDLFFQIYSDVNTTFTLAAPCYLECDDDGGNNGYSQGYSDGLAAGEASCPEDLTSVVDSLEDYIDWADQTISNLQTNLITTGNDLIVWQAAYQTQSAELDSLQAIIDNLSDENADLAAELYECQSDLDVTEGQLNACADNLQDWQLFTAGLQGDLLSVENELDACEAVNDSLLNELATLTIINEDCFYNYGELTDVLNDTLEFYNEVLIGAGTTINELNAEVDALQDALDYAVADGDTCFAEYSALDDQFTAAVFEYEDIIDSLNAIISAVPATIEAIVEPLNAQLEAAQECCSSCPAAIETAADNAYEQGLEDCADAANEACLELLNEAYDGGVADGIAYMEDEVLPQLLVQEYDLGYNAGLADCEGEVSGLVDIDGTVINVIGYYNQLGQVIDPATATGVIIRKHEDGTFSKYFR